MRARDAGKGVYGGFIVPLPFERGGGNEGTGALT